MKLLIVDDHSVVREGFAALLRESGKAISSVLAQNGTEALEAAETHDDLDAVLLDLLLPGMSGWEILAELGRRHPQLPVLVVSYSESPRDVQRALRSGALGYVPKSASPQVLLSALQLILSGNIYVPPILLGEGMVPETVEPQNSGTTKHLTQRQLEVLKLLGEGLPNKLISCKLGLAEKTVKAHITAIFKALGVVNRTQAAKVARRTELID